MCARSPSISIVALLCSSFLFGCGNSDDVNNEQALYEKEGIKTPHQAEKEGIQTRHQPDDVDKLYALADAAKKLGIVTEYKVGGWDHTLDLYIGSTTPSDARRVAQSVCSDGKKLGLNGDRPWTARVFLVIGDRPAATCAMGV